MRRRGGEVLITEETGEACEEKARLTLRHPSLTYIFGDLVRGLYLVGCLALNLMAPWQVRLVVPGPDLVVVPLLVAGVAGLAVLEYRLYRRLWSPRRGKRIAAAVEDRFS